MEWWGYIPGGVIVASAGGFIVASEIVIFRWLIHLQRQSSDHAERISHLEGQSSADSSER